MHITPNHETIELALPRNQLFDFFNKNNSNNTFFLAASCLEECPTLGNKVYFGQILPHIRIYLKYGEENCGYITTSLFHLHVNLCKIRANISFFICEILYLVKNIWVRKHNFLQIQIIYSEPTEENSRLFETIVLPQL